MLRDYSALVINDFPDYCSSETTACILMNNIQQLRIQLEKLFQVMGGEQVSGTLLLAS